LLIQTLNHNPGITADVSALAPSDRKSVIRVLHVDDDPSALEISKQILEDMSSFDFDSACCVDEAFQKLATGYYDVVVSDYEMPKKDGLQFLKELRKQNKQIPFILFTGKGREEVAIKALNLGADGYINKQGDPETVYGELSHNIRLSVENNKIREELQKRDIRLAKFASQTPGMLYQFLMRPDGTYCVPFTSDHICDIFGCTPQDVAEDFSPIAKAILPEDLDKVISSITQSAAKMTQWQCEYRVQLPGQAIRWLWGQSMPEKLDDGSILWSGYNADITDRKKAEQQIRRSAQEWKRTFDAISDFVFILDKESKFTGANKALCDFLSKEPKDLIGKRCCEVLHGINEPLLDCPCSKAKVTRNPESIEKGDADSGSWFLLSVWPFFDENGEYAGCVHTAKNITERKNAEEKLKNMKAFDERIINSLDDALLVIDPDDYKIISSNEVALKQLNLKKEDLIGKTCYETTHHSLTPCKAPEHDCPIRKVLETKEIITVEHKHFDENNNELIVEVSARLVKNPEGKTVVIHVARDITERKHMEKRIREAEKQYHTLFDQAPFGIIVIDPRTAMPVEFNKVVHEQLGYSREEFAKLHVYDYKALQTREETEVKIAKILEKGNAEYETKHRTKNGEIRDVIITAQTIELSGKKLLHSIYRDVTEAKKVDDALMESETKYRQLVELAQEGVWALDNNNYTAYVNPRMAEMLGYSESDMIGKNLATFVDEPNIALHNLQGCKLGHQGQCEFEFVRKDGTRISTYVAASSFHDDTGVGIGTLALVSDITERKKMELNLKESRDKLEVMNEKLRVVGGLTRHDVRNKLASVTGYAYLLRKKYSDQADILDRLDKIELAVKDSVKIFDFAKMYEQLGVEELVYVDVERAVNEASGMFSGLTINIVNGCHGLTVLADSFLRQMFYNFIDNTRKYGKKTTSIRMYCEKAESGELRLIYEDDGMGISAEDKLKLFSEGFSTGGSTGFGLFLTKKMIDVYGWTIDETGEPGKGVRFEIKIPKTNKKEQINYIQLDLGPIQEETVALGIQHSGKRA
jgi:PAS domain S-box-containing protein